MAKPFRFLDLPEELRNMVYERLPRTIRHHRIYPTRAIKLDHYIILVEKSVSTALLATCRQVYTEAAPIVHDAIRNFMINSPPKVICHLTGSYDTMELLGVLLMVVVQCNEVATHGSRRIPPYAKAHDTLAEVEHLYESDSSGAPHARNFINDMMRFAIKTAAYQNPGNGQLTGAPRDLHIVIRHIYPGSVYEAGSVKPAFIADVLESLHVYDQVTRYVVFRPFGYLLLAGVQVAGEQTGTGGKQEAALPISLPIPTRPLRTIAQAEQAMDEKTWQDEWLE